MGAARYGRDVGRENGSFRNFATTALNSSWLAWTSPPCDAPGMMNSCPFCSSLWAITFPGATISLAVLFRKKLQDCNEAGVNV